MNVATVPMVTVDGEDFIASLDDLAVLADGIGARANPLSLIPEGPPNQSARAAEGVRELDSVAQARLAVALGVLRAPGKMAHWHHTIADETISRATLAWSSSVPDLVVAIAGTTDPRRVSFWTQASLTASIRKTLAADESLRDDEIGCKVSTPAVVVFLAVLDQMRAARLHSMLTHSAPPVCFSHAEVMERIRDAGSEDFRWPLLFAEKLIPGHLSTSFTDAAVAAALTELQQAGLVEMAAAGAVPRYELTIAGRLIADGVIHDISKVALGVTDQQGAGKFGRDIVLLVRSAFHLFLFAMAGRTGAIAALANDELAATLHFSLRPAPGPEPELQDTAPVVPLPQAPLKQWYYTLGGQTEGPLDETSLRVRLASLPPDTMVWNQDLPDWMTARDAGLVPPRPASNNCPHCGVPSAPGQRFCMGCGRPRME